MALPGLGARPTPASRWLLLVPVAPPHGDVHECAVRAPWATETISPDPSCPVAHQPDPHPQTDLPRTLPSPTPFVGKCGRGWLSDAAATCESAVAAIDSDPDGDPPPGQSCGSPRPATGSFLGWTPPPADRGRCTPPSASSGSQRAPFFRLQVAL